MPVLSKPFWQCVKCENMLRNVLHFTKSPHLAHNIKKFWTCMFGLDCDCYRNIYIASWIDNTVDYTVDCIAIIIIIALPSVILFFTSVCLLLLGFQFLVSCMDDQQQVWLTDAWKDSPYCTNKRLVSPQYPYSVSLVVTAHAIESINCHSVQRWVVADLWTPSRTSHMPNCFNSSWASLHSVCTTELMTVAAM